MSAKRAPLSDQAVQLLAEIVRINHSERRKVSPREVIPEGNLALWQTMRVLADRGLIYVYNDGRVRPNRNALGVLKAKGLYRSQG